MGGEQLHPPVLAALSPLAPKSLAILSSRPPPPHEACLSSTLLAPLLTGGRGREETHKEVRKATSMLPH